MASLIAAALENPPFEGDDDAKALAFKKLKSALSSVKEANISAVIQELDDDQQDVLMQYIYWGLSLGDASVSALLLRWHESLTKEAGVGSIVRALSDKKTVMPRKPALKLLGQGANSSAMVL